SATPSPPSASPSSPATRSRRWTWGACSKPSMNELLTICGFAMKRNPSRPSNPPSPNGPPPCSG
ncbi:Protein of unknown function, partial [Thermoflexus hugenholtzii JAD2]